MSKPSVINLNDLFGSDEDEDDIKKISEKSGAKVKEIRLSDLVSFKNHRFKLYQGKRLEDMVSSIREYGIITPLILRKLDDEKYEILSGHNRVNAARIVGIESILEDKFVIKEGLSDTDARTIVNETNVIQRGFAELSHSEKASVLAERHRAIKDQGKRKELIEEIENLYKADDLEENTDLGQIDPRTNTRDKVGEQYDLSPSAVSRYLRIDTLTNELKDRIDANEIPLMAGVDLSFLKKDEQEIIESILDDHGFKVDLKKSEILKNYSKGRNFNYDKAYEVLSGKFFDKPKGNKKPKFTPKFTNKIAQKYVTESCTINEVEKIIEELLENYFSQNQEIENEEEFEME